MQFNEVFRDGRTQSEAAESSRDRLIDLLKPIEDLRKKVRLDANTGIRDGDLGVGPRSPQVTVTRPPFAVNLMALERRFHTTCRIACNRPHRVHQLTCDDDTFLIRVLLVFLHAGIADSRMWDDQVRYFSDRYTVVRFDTRGFGQSDLPTEPYRPIEDLNALLKFLKINRASVIGLSMGGMFAIDFTLTHPETVSALIIVAGSPGWEPPPDEVRKRVSAIATAGKETGPAVLAEGWLNDPMLAVAKSRPEIARKIRMFVSQNAPGILMTDLMRPPQVPALRLDDIRVPTLVIVGDRDDPATVERLQAMTGQIPNAKGVVLKGADHMVNLEKPHELNRAIAEFLRSCCSTPRR
jgi:3-oxoadipate enol-lactonase